MDPSLVDDVIFGCVDQVGAQSGNIARNAVLSSSFPESVPGTSVDRQCGSSQQKTYILPFKLLCPALRTSLLVEE